MSQFIVLFYGTFLVFVSCLGVRCAEQLCGETRSYTNPTISRLGWKGCVQRFGHGVLSPLAHSEEQTAECHCGQVTLMCDPETERGPTVEDGSESPTV